MEERRRRRVYCVCSSFSPLFFFNCNPLHTFSPPSPLYVCADLLIAWCVLCACIVTPATPPVTPAMDNGIPIFGGEASLFALPGEKNVFREGTEFWNRIGGKGDMVKVEEKETMPVRLEKVEESMAAMSLIVKDKIDAGFAKIEERLDKVEESMGNLSFLDKDIDIKAIARIEGTSKQLFAGMLQCAVDIRDVHTWALAFTSAQSANNQAQAEMLTECAKQMIKRTTTADELKAMTVTLIQKVDSQMALTVTQNLAVLDKLDLLIRTIDHLVTKKEVLALLEELRLEDEEVCWEIDHEGLKQIVFPQGQDREKGGFVVPINQAGRGNAGAGWCVVM